MNKAQQLHQDIALDSPIEPGRLTFLDTRTIEFYNESHGGKPMSVKAYAIIDGTLRVWLEDREWKNGTMKAVMAEAK